MDGQFNVLTLVLLVLAVIVVLKLRSVLGRRTGEDDARVERYKAQEEARAAAQRANEKVVSLPRRETAAAGAAASTVAESDADAEAKVRAFSTDEGIAAGLLAIHRATPGGFDPEQFMRGGKQAYEMIVTAFAEGNRRTLRNLLSREVFEGFSGAISEREARGEQIDQSFVGITKADLVEAELKGSTAQLTVRFVSELISATRDKAGTVLAGDPKRIKEVIDVWTFARDITSRDPNWKLIATQAPG